MLVRHFNGYLTGDDVRGLDLSIRASNCLERAGIVSVQQFVRLTDEQVFEWENAGRKTVREIRDTINWLGQNGCIAMDDLEFALYGDIVIDGHNS